MNFKKALKPIKKKLAKKDTTYIIIKSVYTHLSELTNEEILDYYNVQTPQELKQHIEYIKNILKNKIKNYKEVLEDIDTCFCRDSHGEFKYLYSTKKEAEQQVKYSSKSKQIKLKLYSCPYHCGWHLSKI